MPINKPTEQPLTSLWPTETVEFDRAVDRVVARHLARMAAELRKRLGIGGSGQKALQTLIEVVETMTLPRVPGLHAVTLAYRASAPAKVVTMMKQTKTCFHCDGKLGGVYGVLGDVWGEHTGKKVCPAHLHLYADGPRVSRIEEDDEPAPGWTYGEWKELSADKKRFARAAVVPQPNSSHAEEPPVSRCCGASMFEERGRTICNRCRVVCRPR